MAARAARAEGLTLAAGSPEADRYLLGLDPHAPDTHSPLASALMRVGIAPTLIGTRGPDQRCGLAGDAGYRAWWRTWGTPDGAEAWVQWPRT